jgi:hypothetical protein
MMKDEENPVVLRYDRNGYLVSRLQLKTMLEITKLDFEPEDIIVKQLSAGHGFRLLDGGWLELENRHV